MTEEPYRWLEAMSHRREYVRDQLKGGTPVLAASLPEGILLLGVGTGHSKVFELFDRHALAGLGHPADLERVRQAAIDAAHLEAFARSREDVSLRRLVGFGLSTLLKTNFEQIYSAPFLGEFLLAELGPVAESDLLVRLHFDGSFQWASSRVLICAANLELEAAAQAWLEGALAGVGGRAGTAELLLQAWWCVVENKPWGQPLPSETERRAGWRAAIRGREVELAWLARQSPRRACYEPLTLNQLEL